jgi:general nucleoside transport system permease protein
MWVQDMTGGRGWIAIALTIFARAQGGRWAALLFGGVEAILPRIAATGARLPQYILLMTPYLATLAVMVWVVLGKRSGLHKLGALGSRQVGDEWL